jgi:hypothetical protein
MLTAPAPGSDSHASGVLVRRRTNATKNGHLLGWGSVHCIFGLTPT